VNLVGKVGYLNMALVRERGSKCKCNSDFRDVLSKRVKLRAPTGPVATSQ